LIDMAQIKCASLSYACQALLCTQPTFRWSCCNVDATVVAKMTEQEGGKPVYSSSQQCFQTE